MEETAGEGRRGAISGEICCSKGEIVGEDWIVFVVGKEIESEKREMNVMSVRNIDEAIFLVAVMMNKSKLVFFCFVFFLSTHQSAFNLCSNDTVSAK